MKITLNGTDQDVEGVNTLRDLIEQFSPDNQRVVAEINGTVIKNPQWEEVPIKEGDTIELVSFVGGG